MWRWHGDQAIFHRRSRLSWPVMRQLIEAHHADIAAMDRRGGFSLLHTACLDDNAELIQFLITRDVDVDVNQICGVDRLTPLYVACVAGSVGAVRRLLALPRTQVNATGSTGSRGSSNLVIACISRNVEVVEALLGHPGVDVNMEGGNLNPLLAATIINDVALLALLLNHPAIRVNAANGTGLRPLYLASSNGYVHVVRELLRHPDIQVNATSVAGLSSLGVACNREHPSVILELLARPELSPGGIREAVTEATMRGQAEIVALLRGHRAVRRAMRGV